MHELPADQPPLPTPLQAREIWSSAAQPPSCTRATRRPGSRRGERAARRLRPFSVRMIACPDHWSPRCSSPHVCSPGRRSPLQARRAQGRLLRVQRDKLRLPQSLHSRPLLHLLLLPPRPGRHVQGAGALLAACCWGAHAELAALTCCLLARCPLPCRARARCPPPWPSCWACCWRSACT